MTSKIINNKNVSPRSLAFVNALILSLIVATLAMIYREKWTEIILITSICFVSAYFIFYKTLEIFIYRKIKLIYKFIHQTKAGKKEEFFNENILPQKSIDEVSKEVLKWGLEKKGEIETLQKNETFRKEFLMNLSHELKTPIFTTQGYIETLLSGAMNDPEVSVKFLKNATKGIDRLVQLTKDLDEISKLESGKTIINFAPIKLVEIIKDVYAELSLKAEQKNIALTFKKDAVSHKLANGDPEKIKQVMVNLIENAIKYGKENGKVTASIYVMDEGHLYIEISDDGPGISEEHLNRIFERFYRVDRGRSRDVGGTGLGLAIVKHIVEAHDQTISVRSKINIGSSFGFTLSSAEG